MKTITALFILSISCFAQVTPIVPTAVNGTILINNLNGTVTTYAFSLSPQTIKGLAQLLADYTTQTTDPVTKVVTNNPKYSDIGDLILRNFSDAIVTPIISKYAPDPALVQAQADLNAKQAALNAANQAAAVIVKTVTTK